MHHLPHPIRRWSLYLPGKLALRDFQTGEAYSYAEVDFITDRMAGALLEPGLQPGERIAVLAGNSVAYVMLFFAVQKIGAILVPLNFRLSPRELAQNLEDCAPSVLIHSENYSHVARDAGRRTGVHRLMTMDAFAQVIEKPANLPEFEEDILLAPNAPCLILFTSGTTGRPKGAIITNNMVQWNAINTRLHLEITPNDHTLNFAPLFHTGGWNVLLTPFLYSGASVTIVEKFDAPALLEAFARERVTILFGVPTMMRMWADCENFADSDLAAVRFAIVGGEPMPIPLIERYHKKGIPIRQGYGLTEVGPNCFSLHHDDAIRKAGSIGRPNFYIRTRIVDDAGNDVAAGEVGELWLAGPVVTPGYWNNPQATAEAITDGWFHTGDLVRRDAQNYYYVVDRKKNMFISGAENVYPAEIEAFLRTHPAVKDVAVVGVPDDKWGEAGAAFIVPVQGASLTPNQLRSFCQGNLARYKIPKHFLFIDSLPVGDTGKIQTNELKEKFKKLRP